MSVQENLRSDLSKVKEQWMSTDSRVRFLDTMSILSLVIFGVAFVFQSIFDIPTTATNVAMMAFPAGLAGILLVFREKINKDIKSIPEAKREFMLLAFTFIALILITVVWAMILDANKP